MAVYSYSRLFRSRFVADLSNFKRFIRKPVPPELGYLQSLEEKLKDIEIKNNPFPIIPNNIGFPLPDIEDKLDRLKELRKKLKKPTTNYGKIIEIPLEEVKAEWEKTTGIEHIKTIADHYGIYKDLYDGGYFYPTTQLKIMYDNEDQLTPIYHGNHVKPIEMKSVPNVSYSSDPQTLWSLVFTNLDCHFKDEASEYLLWFVGNIPGNDLKKGEVICDYLQPFPPRGTGYHRLAFVLYKQTKKINFDSLKRQIPCLSLDARTFRNREFYKQYEDDLTPAGLAFCQCDWDESVSSLFRNVLQMREPIFEYDYPELYVKPQVWNPHRVPFDTYLDKYIPRKLLVENVLLKRLKDTDPFEKEKERPQFPLICSPKDNSSWMRKQRRQSLLGWGKFKFLYD